MKGRTRPDGHDFPPELRQHVDNINGLASLLSDYTKAEKKLTRIVELARDINGVYPGELEVSLNVKRPVVDVLVDEYGVDPSIARKIIGGGIGVD